MSEQPTADRPVRPVDVPPIINARMAEMMGKSPDQCQVFLKCFAQATGKIDHPTLGDVRACQTHVTWYEEMS